MAGVLLPPEVLCIYIIYIYIQYHDDGHGAYAPKCITTGSAMACEMLSLSAEAETAPAAAKSTRLFPTPSPCENGAHAPFTNASTVDPLPLRLVFP